MKLKLVLAAIVVAAFVGLFVGPTEEELHSNDISAEETAEMVSNKVNMNKDINLIIKEQESHTWSYK